MGLAALEVSTQDSRSAAIRRPIISSPAPPAYASAVSMKLTPASRARSSMRAASASSVRAANIMVPRQSGETLRPLLPKFR